MSTPVALILGAGPRIGTSVAKAFASNGYKVAVASRTGGPTGYLSLRVDLTKPDSITALFDAVKSEFNASPSAVVYNAAALTVPSDNTTLSLSSEQVALDLNVNTISPYIAAQEAVAGWKTLPKEFPKAFIYTGNHLNVNIVPAPMWVNLAMGKAASAAWIGLADATYSDFRFFYADERQGDGSSGGKNLDGPAHGKFFVQLAKHEGNVPWHATFVAGTGYVQFK